MADSYIEVTSQDFAEKVLDAEQMVVVNFTSDQSPACQIQAPEFNAVSQEYQGRVTFARLDVDKNGDLVRQWNIDGIPTIIFFNRGVEIHRIKGILMRDRLRKQVEGALLVTDESTTK